MPFGSQWFAVSAEFQPTDIANCQYWFRADLGITKDGSDFVSQWDDQTANGRDLSESTNKPLWVDSLINSQPAVRFDGSNDTIGHDYAESYGATFHVFQLFNSVSWTNNDYVANYEDGGANGYVRQIGTSPQIKQGGTDANVNPVSLTIGSFGLVQSGFTGGTTIWQTLNDGSKVTGADPGGTPAFGEVRLGSNHAGGQNGNVEIAEIIGYSAEISGADLTNLLSYFSDRYAIW